MQIRELLKKIEEDVAKKENKDFAVLLDDSVESAVLHGVGISMTSGLGDVSSIAKMTLIIGLTLGVVYAKEGKDGE